MSGTIPFVDYLALEPEPHLVANECTNCGARFFDRRNACAGCGGTAFDPVAVDTDGVLTAFTIVSFAAPGVPVPFVAGVGVVAFALAVAYLSGVAAVRLRLDPDTYGVPVVTSSVDLVGAALLTGVAVLLGVVA